MNKRQKEFVIEYMKDFNATQAAIRAGYSEKGARVQGVKLLTNPNIQAEIEKKGKGRELRAEVSADDVIRELKKIAFSDITKFVKFGKKEFVIDRDRDGNPITEMFNYVDFLESHEVDGTLISEVKKGKDGVSLKLHDKLKALELIGKHFGMFDERKAMLKLKEKELKLKEMEFEQRQHNEEDEEINAVTNLSKIIAESVKMAQQKDEE